MAGKIWMFHVAIGRAVTIPEELVMAAVEIRSGYVAVKEAGRQEGRRKAGRKAERKAVRKVGRKAGRKDC